MKRTFVLFGAQTFLLGIGVGAIAGALGYRHWEKAHPPPPKQTMYQVVREPGKGFQTRTREDPFESLPKMEYAED